MLGHASIQTDANLYASRKLATQTRAQQVSSARLELRIELLHLHRDDAQVRFEEAREKSLARLASGYD